MKSIFYILLLLLCSCAASEVRKSDHTFRDANGSQKVSVVVPKGHKDEMATLDNGEVKALHYEFPNGAVFYYVYQPSWTTLNQAHIEAAKAGRKSRSDAMFKGVDSAGLHWKEMRLENLRYGYVSVPAADLSRFENAIL